MEARLKAGVTCNCPCNLSRNIYHGLVVPAIKKPSAVRASKAHWLDSLRPLIQGTQCWEKKFIALFIRHATHCSLKLEQAMLSKIDIINQ